MCFREPETFHIKWQLKRFWVLRFLLVGAWNKKNRWTLLQQIQKLNVLHEDAVIRRIIQLRHIKKSNYQSSPSAVEERTKKCCDRKQAEKVHWRGKQVESKWETQKPMWNNREKNWILKWKIKIQSPDVLYRKSILLKELDGGEHKCVFSENSLSLVKKRSINNVIVSPWFARFLFSLRKVICIHRFELRVTRVFWKAVCVMNK